jgi:hypothetical protein
MTAQQFNLAVIAFMSEMSNGSVDANRIITYAHKIKTLYKKGCAEQQKQAASEAWDEGINSYKDCVSPIEKAKQQFLKKHDNE